jgi:hypothetical protein
MKTVSVSVSCEWCGSPAPDAPIQEGWEIDLPVRVGNNPTRAIDLCPDCLAAFTAIVGSGEIVKKQRVYRPKNMKAVQTTTLQYRCRVASCGRSFPTERGRGMHYVRMHDLTYEGDER